MAIIRYTKDNGNVPSYISDGGYLEIHPIVN